MRGLLGALHGAVQRLAGLLQGAFGHRLGLALGLVDRILRLLQRILRGGTGLPGKGLFGSTSPWYTGGSDQYDPTKAKQLLKEAEASGFDGKLNYVYNASPSDQAGAVTLKAMLENVGFKVTLVPLRSVADQVQRLYVNHDFDLAVAGTTIPDLDPYARLASTFNAQSPTNLSGWGSPEMDQLLTQLQAKDTPDQGKTVMAQIEKLWEDQVPGFSLDSGGVFQAWNKNVHGVDPTSEDLLLYNKAWKS